MKLKSQSPCNDKKMTVEQMYEAFGIEPKKTLVKTGDWLDRNMTLYEVVIADNNIFVVCPLKYSKKEKSMIVKYSKPEIYANQIEINTLTDLGFCRC